MLWEVNSNVNRLALCFSTFLLLLLVLCTVLSPKVKEEMMTVAETRTAEALGGRRVKVGAFSLEWEGYGHDKKLLALGEGSGWEDGMRVSEIPSKYYEDCETHVILGPGAAYLYVYNASRVPTLGEEVAITKVEKAEDDYLVVSSVPIPEENAIPRVWKILTRRDSVLMFHMNGAVFPYFEHTFWYKLRDALGEDVRIFSMRELEQFSLALPWLSWVLVAIAGSLFLWSVTWVLSFKHGFRKTLWAVNTVLIVLMILAIPRLLKQFDLPPSLMPAENILDFSHYSKAFAQIHGALDTLGVRADYNWVAEAGSRCVKILCGSALGLFLLVAFECRLSRRHKKRALFPEAAQRSEKSAV